MFQPPYINKQTTYTHCVVYDKIFLYCCMKFEHLNRKKEMQQQLFLFMLTLFKLTQSLESESLESESLDCEFRSSYPRHIVTHKLQEKEEIKIDGKLDEDAWTVIEWSDDFQDIR